ncbi:MAG: cytochrome c maturation protein CcmE [Anaerolineales bacterium]|jgi:cytochrome c-type biogenesis protein CcmE
MDAPADAAQKTRMGAAPTPHRSGVRLKFLIGGGLILIAVAYLIFSSTQTAGQYFMTVQELQSHATNLGGRTVRVSGAVVGGTIRYDVKDLRLTFTIANVPGDMNEVNREGGLAAVLHAAVLDPQAPRLQVIYAGPEPDLLRPEAQAIITGHLGADGVFQADELLLQCPTRYQEALPSQAQG